MVAFRRLFRYGLNQWRVTMSQAVHRYAGAKVQVLFSLGIVKPDAFPPGKRHRKPMKIPHKNIVHYLLLNRDWGLGTGVFVSKLIMLLERNAYEPKP
jgi:hypothetical protein